MIVDVLEIYSDGRQEIVQREVPDPEPPAPQPPTTEERLIALEAENSFLKIQNRALADQLEFLTDFTTEMIITLVP